MVTYIQLHIMKKVCTARSLLTNKKYDYWQTYNWCSNTYTEICIFLKVCLLDYICLLFLKTWKIKSSQTKVKLKHIHVQNQYEFSK